MGFPVLLFGVVLIITVIVLISVCRKSPYNASTFDFSDDAVPFAELGNMNINSPRASPVQPDFTIDEPEPDVDEYGYTGDIGDTRSAWHAARERGTGESTV